MYFKVCWDCCASDHNTESRANMAALQSSRQVMSKAGTGLQAERRREALRLWLLDSERGTNKREGCCDIPEQAPAPPPFFSPDVTKTLKTLHTRLRQSMGA
ncbi:uncharacterized protein LOC144223281 isoform X2 [Crocuta crocuta]